MPQPLVVYTRQPESYPARVFAEYLATTSHRPVRVLPLSALPAPPSWLVRRRAQLTAEQTELREAIQGLTMGLALAAADPHRFPDWAPAWQADQEAHERRLRVVTWKLQQLDTMPEGGPRDA